jgi:hypothetical protein
VEDTEWMENDGGEDAVEALTASGVEDKEDPARDGEDAKIGDETSRGSFFIMTALPAVSAT